ncbi:four-helix bundle copper-binding protein [Nocardia transvalensis]|uniref:four-helix bundle copper-binding protein n=1 Tax=Nocardia transvalensis TaxID=37333 RepID=UPI001896250C|nr:four-helix bundle copper-binding protein [Nocardia transvalensis]MBF6330019.1 four-helix bundle copper-binding protein [Nocardia transvalensis]
MTDATAQNAINHLLGCHRRCTHQIRESLDRGGEHATAHHIQTLTDCADLCRLTGDLLDRRSEWNLPLCELTIRVCTDTAERCDRLGETACATVCRATAAACTLYTDQIRQATEGALLHDDEWLHS